MLLLLISVTQKKIDFFFFLICFNFNLFSLVVSGWRHQEFKLFEFPRAGL